MRTTAALTLACTLAACPALAQETSAPTKPEQPAKTTQPDAGAKLPDGFAILEKHVEAVGGEEKNKAFKASRMSGEFSIPAMDLTGEITISSKAPSSTLIVVDLPGMGQVVQGTDGKLVWAAQPGQRMQVLEGGQAEELKNQAQFYASIEPRKTYTEAKAVAIVEHEGTRCYKVNLTTSWGSHQVGLYEVETGLLRKMSVRASAESDTYTNETAFSDYQETQGIKHARRLELNNGQMQQVMTFHTVELDPEFEEGLFDPPGEL
ncbi:MAG: hypothetical protein ACIAQ0_00925 [Phycisphaerales bacterium JB058]